MNYLKKELYNLIKNEEHIFDFIQEYALDGMWYWDLETPEEEWMNPKFWVTLGYDPAKMPHKASAWQSIIDPEDLKIATENFIKHCENPDHPYDQIVRYTHKKGHIVWIRCKGIAIRDKTGKPLRMLGVHVDITKQKKYELELKERINRYSHIIEGTDMATWEWNVQTGETVFNEHWANIIGYKLSEISPVNIDTWSKYTHPDDVEKIYELLEIHFEGKTKFFECEVRMKHRDGHWVWVLDKGKVVSRTPEGEPLWVTGSHQDITERKKAEESLKESAKRNRLFIEQSPSAIAMFDRDICYLAASRQWLKDYGLEGKDVIGKSHYEIFPEIGEEWKAIHQKCLRGEVDINDQAAFVRQDGSTQWLAWDVRPWYVKKDVIGGLLMYTADITSIKKNEQLLSKYQDLLGKTNEVAAIGTWELDMVRDMVSWSAVTKKIHEVPADYEPVLEKAIDFFPEGEHRDKILQAVNDAVEKGINYDLELQIKTHKNNLKWVRAVGISEFENEKCVRLYGIFQDVDEKTKANKALAFQEEQFRKTFEYAAIGMALVALDGQWLKVNKNLCDMLGYTEEELLKLTFADITYPEDLKRDMALVKELLAGTRESYQMEKRYFHKDEQIVWTLLSVSLVKNNLGEPIHFVSQINNITDTKIAQNQLQKNINRLQSIQDASTQVCIIETGMNGIIKSFNKGAENLLGYTAQEMIDKQSPAIIHVKKEALQRGKELSKEFNEKIEGFEIFVTYAKRGLFETREWTYVRKDSSTFPVLLTVTAVKDNDNKIVGFLGIAFDISLLKKAENEVKSLLDVTQEQNSRLLNFAHIVSHNLKSHSGNLAMLLDLMHMEIPEATKNDFFPLLNDAANNLQETIDHLNEVVVMNTQTSETFSRLSLYEYVEKAIVNIKGLVLETGATIQNKVDKDLAVQAIPAYLESITLNFLTNAIKYRSPERKPLVKITSAVQKDFVVLRIEDNGRGINLKAHGHKLFGMYKTFHGNKDARGIGLFITKNQIETMGGKVKVTSEVDKGTVFEIYLKYEKD